MDRELFNNFLRQQNLPHAYVVPVSTHQRDKIISANVDCGLKTGPFDTNCEYYRVITHANGIFFLTKFDNQHLETTQGQATCLTCFRRR